MERDDKISEVIHKDIKKDNNKITYHTEDIGFCCRESRETRRGNKADTKDNITEKIKKKGSRKGD